MNISNEARNFFLQGSLVLALSSLAINAAEAPAAIQSNRISGDPPSRAELQLGSNLVVDIGIFAVATKIQTSPSNITTILRRIGGCESGRPQAPDSRINWKARALRDPVKPSGGLQISIGTWNNYMGYKEAYKAPPWVQARKGRLLANENGGQGKYRHWASTRWCWDI